MVEPDQSATYQVPSAFGMADADAGDRLLQKNYQKRLRPIKFLNSKALDFRKAGATVTFLWSRVFRIRPLAEPRSCDRPFNDNDIHPLWQRQRSDTAKPCL
ncbi:MAG: hypothetical protein AAF609_16115 [Cyanobacteria bacterium P01_C01_bin.120]